MNKTIIILFAVTLSACVTTLPPGEISSATMAEYEKGSSKRSFSALQQRAEFDSGCDALKYNAISEVNISTNASHSIVKNGAQIGASGCGNKSVYIMTDSGWVLNSN